MVSETTLWFVFIAVFLVLMVFDLFFVERKGGTISVKKASAFVALYVAVAIAFGILIYFSLDADHATSYFAAYVIELSMSVDNLFVFIVLFGLFMIPAADQHKVLFWGILGAIFFRAVFIFIGAELLSRFDFMMYVFGLLLLYTAFKTVFSKEGDDDQKNSLAYKLSKHIRATDDCSSNKFFTVENGVRVATPLFLCLIVIELSDIMFAFDSIPAALSITTDIFIVYASNIFAVLGLRSMFFVINGALNALDYLKYGLGVILAFIGVKMLISAADVCEISVLSSLAFILVVLTITIVASLLHRKHTMGSVE